MYVKLTQFVKFVFIKFSTFKSLHYTVYLFQKKSILYCNLQAVLCVLLTVPADSLSDHLLAHNVEESDSEGTKNEYGSLKVCGSYWCICMYIHVCVLLCCCLNTKVTCYIGENFAYTTNQVTRSSL